MGNNQYKMNQDESYIYDIIITQIKMGFKSMDVLFEYVTEIIQEERLDMKIEESWVKDLIESEYRKRMEAAENEWGYPTDPFLLADAFDELRRMGIIAIHNAGYTTSDGEADVVEIESALREHGIESEGYCFYHEQDLERALDEDNPMLPLSFQKVDNSDPAVTEKMGHIIVDVLRKNKLNANWSGDVNEKIIISPILWNKVYEKDFGPNFNFGESYYIIKEKYSS